MTAYSRSQKSFQICSIIISVHHSIPFRLHDFTVSVLSRNTRVHTQKAKKEGRVIANSEVVNCTDLCVSLS